MPCRATKPNGSACRAPDHLIDPETGFCHAHGPGASERMRARGKKGSRALRDKLRRPNVQADDWQLETLEDAQERLRRIAMAVLAGHVSHQQASAAVRALDTWLKAAGERMDAEDVEELREIAKQLKGSRKLRVAK